MSPAPPNEIPPLPADAATKSYVLAAIGGELRWFPMLFPVPKKPEATT